MRDGMDDDKPGRYCNSRAREGEAEDGETEDGETEDGDEG